MLFPFSFSFLGYKILFYHQYNHWPGRFQRQKRADFAVGCGVMVGCEPGGSVNDVEGRIEQNRQSGLDGKF
jgi:hypothetical protein